ncbi:MAG: type II secretion system F family protein [Syntrophothermus sp.]|uniref:type II secretion system F family protein n=1 Tax=Syntrophothermus sp. TaxID=2736299 RepID=UPI00257EB3D7|nr:type II secretion system F family protein [Syntrophothermus sp.]NSW83998.1 type II secretion system F family protein [Syntrophothermus sp.]
MLDTRELLLAVTAGGFSLALVPSLYAVFKKLNIKTANRTGRKKQASGLSESLQKWVDRVHSEMRVSFLERRSVLEAAIMIVLALAGFGVGVVYLKNITAGIIMAAGGIAVPEQMINMREQARREKILEQMGAMVRIFAAEFSETPHVLKALGVTAGKMPPPTGDILRQAYRDMTSGMSPDEALLRLARGLDNEYGRMFVQLLRLALEDEAVKPLFNRLALRLTTQQDLLQKNRVEMSYDRMVSLIMNLAIVPAFIFVHQLVPEAREFFVSSIWGRLIVSVSAASVVGGAFLDRLASGGIPE